MYIYDKDFIGKKLKEYRRKSKLTQEKLAEKINIAEKHYGKLERGEFSPSLETFFKLISELGIPLNEFGIVESEDIKNDFRNNVIKEIYTADDNELKLFLKILKDIKEYNNS